MFIKETYQAVLSILWIISKNKVKAEQEKYYSFYFRYYEWTMYLQNQTTNTVIELCLLNKEHNSMLMLKLKISLGAQRWSFVDIKDDQQCSSFKRKVN